MLFAPPVECPSSSADTAAMLRHHERMHESAMAVVRERRVLVGVYERMALTLKYFGSVLFGRTL